MASPTAPAVAAAAAAMTPAQQLLLQQQHLWTALRAGRGDLFLAAASRQPALLASKDEQGNTPAHWLALRGETERLKELLAMGGAADMPGLNAQTPLMWAVIAGHLGTSRALLAAGAAVNARDSLGASPAILAVQHARYLLLLVLADAGADLAAGDVRGCGPAHWAAYKDEPTLLRMLARRGVDLGAPDGEGLAPLHRAARGGALAAARFLLDEAGVDPCALVAAPPQAAAAAAAAAPAAAQTAAASGDAPAPAADGDASAPSSAAASSAGVEHTMPQSSASTGGVRSRGTVAAPAVATPAPGRAAILAKRPMGPVAGAAAALGGGAFHPPAGKPTAAGDGADAIGSPTSAGSRGQGARAPPTAAAAAAVHHQNAVTVAEDALRIMVSSARAAGTYAGPENRGLIAKQTEVIAYLRRAAEDASGRTDGLPHGAPVTAGMGRAALVSYRLRRALGPLTRPDAWERLAVPGLYAAAFALAAWTWAAHLTGWTAPSALGVQYALLAAWGALYAALQRRDPGACDPYGALGKDAWTARPPWAPLVDALRRRRTQRGVGGRGSRAAAAAVDDGGESAPMLSSSSPATSGSGTLASIPRAATARLLGDYDALVDACTRALGADVAAFPLVAGSPEQPAVSNALNPAVAVAHRVCYACELIRPLRAEHHPLTGRCYERFDRLSRRLGVPVAHNNLAHYAGWLAVDAAVGAVLLGAMWEYLGGGVVADGSPLLSADTVAAFLSTSASAAGEVASDVPEPGLFDRLRVLLTAGSWGLLAFAAFAAANFGQSAVLLYGLAKHAAANVTSLEDDMYLSPPKADVKGASVSGGGLGLHPAALLHVSSVAVEGGESGSSSSSGGPLELVPRRVNPFDTGSWARNVVEFLTPVGAGGPGQQAVTLPAVFARHATELQAVADAIARATAAAAAAAGDSTAVAVGGDAGAAARALPMPTAVTAAASPTSAASEALEPGEGAKVDAASAAAAAATASGPQRGGGGGGGALPPQHPMAAAMAAVMGSVPPAVMARQRALAMRASLSATPQAWSQFEARYALAHNRTGGHGGWRAWLSNVLPHGHSHAGPGGGHGHSHGGGGGGGGHGHSHGGGAPPAAAAPAGGGGGHGHSHGGGECDGKH